MIMFIELTQILKRYVFIPICDLKDITSIQYSDKLFLKMLKKVGVL